MISGKAKTVGSCVLDFSFIQLHSNFFFILCINYTYNNNNNTHKHYTTSCTSTSTTTTKIKFSILLLLSSSSSTSLLSNLTAHLYQDVTSKYYFYYSRSFYFELSEYIKSLFRDRQVHLIIPNSCFFH